MKPIPDFNLYSAAFVALLKEDRLNPLGPGSPYLEVRDQLQALSVETAFGDHVIKDRHMANACISALWLYHDFLEESHSLSQSLAMKEGSYWHGIMHRREPDFSNSKYWFRRVGDHAIFESLREEAAQLAATTESDKRMGFLTKQKKWDPFQFIDLCESCIDSGSLVEMLCRQIQQREWWLLFDYCYRRAVG